MDYVTHTFVDLKTSWDEDAKTGTATYQAPAHKIIKYVDFSASTWGVSGYSSHLSRSSGLYEYIEKINREADKYLSLYQSENDSQKKQEYQQKEKEYRDYLLKIASSNDTVQVNWRCKSDGSFYDRKRGKVHVWAKIYLEDYEK